MAILMWYKVDFKAKKIRVKKGQKLNLPRRDCNSKGVCTKQ